MASAYRPTPNQREALAAVAAFSADKGYPPSYRDLSAALGYRSTSTAHQLVKRLRELGYIKPGDALARSLVLTVKGQRVARETARAAGVPSP